MKSACGSPVVLGAAEALASVPHRRGLDLSLDQLNLAIVGAGKFPLERICDPEPAELDLHGPIAQPLPGPL